MFIRHRNKFIIILVLSILANIVAVFTGTSRWLDPNVTSAVVEQKASEAKDGLAQHFKLTEHRRTHILVGSETGGGHRFGAGQPGKTEFPQSWNDDKIIETVIRIANDQNLPMRQSGKRYWLRMGEAEGLQIRVVLDRERGEIITGYPVEARK